jgi:hypothetical protein
VAVAFYLQRDRGDEPILLPLMRLSALLSVDTHTVSRWRAWARRDGYLELVSESSHVRHRADEFRLRIELFETSTGEQK